MSGSGADMSSGNPGNKGPSLEGMPRYLYKFRSVDEKSIRFTRRIITESELFFSCPLDLNDPFEGYFAFDRVDFGAAVPALAAQFTQATGEAHRQEALQQHLPSILESYRLKTREDYLRNVGIVSLTARNDSTLMWAHYADSHRGLCFEFDLTVGAHWGVAIVPVIYSEQCLVGKVSDMGSLSEVMTASVYHKSADWAYEKEWRFIHFKGCGARKFPPRMLSGVIFGSQVSSDIGQEIFNELKAYPHAVNIGHAGRDPFSYSTRVVYVGDSHSGVAKDVSEARPWITR